MSEPVRSTRRAKRLLSAEQKHEIWLKILTGEVTTNEAAALVSSGREPPLYLVERLWRGSVGAGCSPRRVGLYPPVT